MIELNYMNIVYFWFRADSSDDKNEQNSNSSKDALLAAAASEYKNLCCKINPNNRQQIKWNIILKIDNCTHYLDWK